jgi:DNA-directed RNA polymerase specialized sigma24 family protein
LATSKQDWTLTKEAFERLLDQLDQNRDQAGQKYENIRRKLIEFFEARGSESTDEHADETINRVARRITEGEKVENIVNYVYGVARLVWLEALRARHKSTIPLDLAPVPIAPNHEELHREQLVKEERFKCFEDCLGDLPVKSRILVVDYYREEAGSKMDHRKRQAEALKMSLNALRLRACRLRNELAVCIENCLERSSADTKTTIYH